MIAPLLGVAGDYRARAQLIPEYRRDFVLGGNAKFTVVSKTTFTRFTYHVKRRSTYTRREMREDKCEDMFTVHVLTGADSTYTHLGFIVPEGAFKHTYRMRPDAPSMIAFAWVWKHLESDQFEFWHAGSCGRCGRELTDPESIQRGIGPICSEKG